MAFDFWFVRYCLLEFPTAFFRCVCFYIYLSFGILILLHLIRIFQIVKRHQTQIQVQQQAVQSSDNLNIIRLKKSSMNTFVFFIVLLLCYFPLLVHLIRYRNFIYNTFYWKPEWPFFLSTLVFMNSSINPVLYC